MNPLRITAVAMAASAMLALSACGGTADADESSLTFAMPPGSDDPESALLGDAIAAQIGDVTGLDITVENPADYTAVVEAVRSGFVDVAVMSPFSTALAVENDSVVPILAWEAEKTPASRCLVRKDSGIDEVAQIAGKEVAYVDPGSATGHFLPKSMLIDNGLVDGEDYTSTFAGSHDSAVLAMVNGSVDMACTAAMLYPTLVESGVIDEDEIKVLAETDSLPVGITVIVRKDLDPDIQAKITEELPALMMGDEQTATLLAGATEYTADPTDADFAPLLAVAEKIGLSLEDIR